MNHKKLLQIALFATMNVFAAATLARPARAEMPPPPDTCPHTACEITPQCTWDDGEGCRCFIKNNQCDGNEKCAIE